MHKCSGMDDLLSPIEVERRAAEAGLTIKEVCERAGIARSTFSRWKSGKTAPTLTVYHRIREVLASSPSEAA